MKFNSPFGIAMDPTSEYIFVTDTIAADIKKVSLRSGYVTSIAPLTTWTQLDAIICNTDTEYTLYVSDYGRISAISVSSNLSDAVTIAGSPYAAGGSKFLFIILKLYYLYNIAYIRKCRLQRRSRRNKR